MPAADVFAAWSVTFVLGFGGFILGAYRAQHEEDRFAVAVAGMTAGLLLAALSIIGARLI